MTEIERPEFQCVECGAWFPSLIDFADEKAFDTCGIKNIGTNCTACGKDVPLSKANLRWVSKDGKTRYSGNDTRGPTPKR